MYESNYSYILVKFWNDLTLSATLTIYFLKIAQDYINHNILILWKCGASFFVYNSFKRLSAYISLKQFPIYFITEWQNSCLKDKNEVRFLQNFDIFRKFKDFNGYRLDDKVYFSTFSYFIKKFKPFVHLLIKSKEIRLIILVIE